MTRVPVNPELLQWACERSGIAYESLVAKFEKLPEWESGKTKPTLKQVEKFAHAVHVPVGYLFLTEPPEELVPIPDFRTFAGQAVARPSPNLLDAIYTCQERQSWYRDSVRVARQPELAFVGSATVEPPLRPSRQRYARRSASILRPAETARHGPKLCGCSFARPKISACWSWSAELS